MSQSQRYLCFNLGKEEYAIPLLKVREVIGMPELTPIPQMPPYIMGMMNLRGNVITVMDLRSRLGIKSKSTQEEAVIIVEIGPINLGCAVDAVNSVISISPSEILEKPQLENMKSLHYIEGVIHRENSLILLLDIGRALSIEEQQLIQQNNKPKAA
ncbi:MAG: chemotaxis protein CheW [Bdellovibrionaceae bacterium]|nr:chemotaxis protein CheW [Pseudobdellovibrionaceae bacterium]MDW8190136.1 chemotaxis protein CheW [Pseudobdellovibrionaceae bacterium]